MRPCAVPSSLTATLLVVGVLVGCAAMSDQKPAADYATIVAAPDRRDADRNTDQRRDPVRLFAFTRSANRSGAQAAT